MRALSEKQARAFFREIIESAVPRSDAGEVLINGRIVKDWRAHSPHAVRWYDIMRDEWSTTNLMPSSMWAIEQDGAIIRFVNSLDYAMHKCGFEKNPGES